jgi:hypothetical protein
MTEWDTGEGCQTVDVGKFRGSKPEGNENKEGMHNTLPPEARDDGET